MITTCLKAYLLADATLNAEVSGRIVSRLPQEIDLPAIKFTTVFETETIFLSGVSDRQESIIRFHIFAGDYANLVTVAKLVRERLKGASGVMGTCTVDACIYEGARDADFDPELEVYQRALDFRVHYKS